MTGTPKGFPGIRTSSPRLLICGHWEIKVAKPGSCRITLMERPPEANHPIAATSAVLEVGGKTFKQAIPAGAKLVHFDVKLNAGQSRLKSILTNDSGATRGAYYAIVLRLSTP